MRQTNQIKHIKLNKIKQVIKYKMINKIIRKLKILLYEIVIKHHLPK
jgi:hypothetical protein